jgi:hypothetical protein
MKNYRRRRSADSPPAASRPIVAGSGTGVSRKTPDWPTELTPPPPLKQRKSGDDLLC